MVLSIVFTQRLKHQLSILVEKIWTALTRDEVQNSKFNHTYHIYYRNNLIFILRFQYTAFESILPYVYPISTFKK